MAGLGQSFRSLQRFSGVLCMQVNAPYDMAELSGRLLPFGAYVPFPLITPQEQRYALDARLHINSFGMGVAKQQFIDLLPLPVPYLRPGDLPGRMFPVSVISSDGRDKPVMFGLTIEKVRGPCSSYPWHAVQMGGCVCNISVSWSALLSHICGPLKRWQAVIWPFIVARCGEH